MNNKLNKLNYYLNNCDIYLIYDGSNYNWIRSWYK